ncbi:type II toxin-antitoxin system RelE/ParE family toxin [Antarcticirhabdus aurantiaca]|uniref:Type II toxin-antitoxin system RelE/ParE family toxin n=1 Tax=Antarcticirhabdus aurantiaca TaxID=2606717 RepID=A0ACD4NSV7_9HYPH|nr:type II toxin-antitoxin system RelE/ParE family toxin [Antarcticirhabdus aurantiaca]WAJ30055.1 type II toxin-antitoxin system RelE/ParE family toxin [Jeongeuplla avenae]
MTVRWTRPALQDVEQIQDFVAKDSPVAARRLAQALISRSTAILADNPSAGRAGRVADTRELVVSGTAFIVVYRLRQSVEILAVFHGAREWPDEFSA